MDIITGLSNKETTCTALKSVVGFKLQSLLELHSSDLAIDHRYTRVPPRPHVAEHFHYSQIKRLIFQKYAPCQCIPIMPEIMPAYCMQA